MKSLYLFVLLTVTINISNAQIVNIPDANFKAKLLSHDPVIDTNGDNEIQISEAENFNQWLNLDNEYNTPDEMKIVDMTGIEFFINIQNLSFDYNLVSSIDLSKNTLLTSLGCYNNKLSSLDVSNNLNLTHLAFQDNNLTTLDVTNNNLLSRLFCGENNLTSLDITQNTQLTVLNCFRNRITSLDVSNNPLLESLICSDNLISTLDVSDLLSLTTLSCGSNLLTTIDVSANTSLIKLSCSYNEITNLFLDNNTDLALLTCGYNPLTNLDVTKLTKLEHLVCDRTPLANIDLSNNLQLSYLFIYDVPIKAIDVSQNILLERFTAGDNAITSLDFSQNINLKSANCTNAYMLESVNLKNTTNATSLNQINFRNSPNLKTICVDDVAYAQDNFSVNELGNPNIDAAATFVEDCDITLAYNKINGRVTFDEDKNGCDISDSGIPNTLVKVTDGVHQFSTLTDSNGNFSLSVVKNSYNTQPIQLLGKDYFTTTPQAYTNTFAGYGLSDNNIDFCTLFNEDVNDVNIILIPITESQPGQTSKYQLVYENLGSNVSEGSITVEFDNTLTSFGSATPAPIGSTNNTISFNYTDLQPFEKRVIDINFNTSLSANAEEDEIVFETTISPSVVDVNTSDNFYIYNQPVENNYTANKKEVLQGAEITIEEAANYLDYIIRFQNTSTETATNIAIVDILNHLLDWDTIKIISSSHDFRIRITDSRIVEFIFENINLPAQQDDETGSKGFIAFRVKPPAEIGIGNIISGKTDVYYELSTPTEKTISNKSYLAKTSYNYSVAIETNTVSTTVVEGSTLSNGDKYLPEQSFKLYPNPVNETFSIQVSDDIILNKITIYSATGQNLLEMAKPKNTYDISGFKTGVYFVKLETNLGVFHRQIVKR